MKIYVTNKPRRQQNKKLMIHYDKSLK